LRFLTYVGSQSIPALTARTYSLDQTLRSDIFFRGDRLKTPKFTKLQKQKTVNYFRRLTATFGINTKNQPLPPWQSRLIKLCLVVIITSISIDRVF
jgi:hypothetical protein